VWASTRQSRIDLAYLVYSTSGFSASCSAVMVIGAGIGDPRSDFDNDNLRMGDIGIEEKTGCGRSVIGVGGGCAATRDTAAVDGRAVTATRARFCGRENERMLG
jgi:hypothetical protein